MVVCVVSMTKPEDQGIRMEPSKKPLNVLVKQLNAGIAVMLKNHSEYKGKINTPNFTAQKLLELFQKHEKFSTQIPSNFFFSHNKQDAKNWMLKKLYQIMSFCL